MSTNPQTLTLEESQLLLDHLQRPVAKSKDNLKGLRNYTMCLLMLDAGLRVGEVCSLTYGDLVFENSPLSAVTIRGENSKTKTERTVPISPRLFTAIVEMLIRIPSLESSQPTNPFFCHMSHREPITVRQVQRIIKCAGQAAFGRRIHPHILRHTFATRLMKVLDIRGVQQLLGHAHLTSTQIYTHPDSESLKVAINAISKTA